MQGQAFVLVPEDWLHSIEGKLDQLLQDQSGRQEEPGPTMDAAEAAAYLRVDRNTLYRWARSNTVPHVRVGSKLYFYKRELDDWMKER